MKTKLIHNLATAAMMLLATIVATGCNTYSDNPANASKNLTDAEKASLKLAKQAAGDSVKSFMSTLKQGERRLAGIVTVGYGASKKTVMALIRRSDPEDTEYDEDTIGAEAAEESENI